MITGFMMDIPLLLVMMLSMTDIDAILNSTILYAELLRQTAGSKVWTKLIIWWTTFVLFGKSRVVFSCVLQSGVDLDQAALIGQWVHYGRFA